MQVEPGQGNKKELVHTAERVAVVQEVGGNGFGGGVDGRFVGIQGGFRVDWVENHNGRVFAGLSGSR